MAALDARTDGGISAGRSTETTGKKFVARRVAIWVSGSSMNAVRSSETC